jgi:hypothetical protein
VKGLQDKLAHEEVRQGVDVASFFRTECSPLEGVCVPCRVVSCRVVSCRVVSCGVVWCGVVWCGVVWCGVVCVQSSQKSATVEAKKKLAKYRVCGCVLQRCSEAAYIDPSVVALLRTCDCS